MIGKQWDLIGAVLVALGLVACGSGDGGQVAGIDRTGSPTTVYGTVTTFGSVVVNGVHYDTSRAQFTIDGAAGTQQDLAVGDVVLLKGTLDVGGTTGVAATIVFDDAVEGPIAAGSIDVAAGTLVVLGQTVRVGPDTSFDSSLAAGSVADLVDGTVVEVSGFAEADGSIRATRIERKSGTGLEVTGIVGNLDTVGRTFTINAQLVDYSSVLQLEDFPASGIANGQRVEVKGSTSLAGALRATRVEYEGGLFGGASGDRREIEGFVTRFGSASDFDVAGVPVVATSSTVVQGALGLNVKVEVEGTLNAAGAIVATKIEVRASSAVRVAALVDSVNPAAGTFVVLGVTVRIDAVTRIEDKSSQRVTPLVLTSMAAGNYVRVRGTEFPAGSGQLLATLVERDDPEPDVELDGFVQSEAAPSFSVLGVAVDTTGARLRDSTSSSLTSAQFFGALDSGDLVRIKGVEISDRTIQADEVEIEP